MSDPIRPAARNYLSPDVEIKGLVKFQNDLSFDGKLEGEIISPGSLTIGETAEITGEIKTRTVRLHGKVNGNITVDERCELKGSAVLIGDLKAARLTIEGEATLIGKSEVTPGKIPMKPLNVLRAPELIPGPTPAPLPTPAPAPAAMAR